VLVAGSGGNNAAGYQASCDKGLYPWPIASLIDVADEKNPKVASSLALEMHDPKNCSKTLPHVAGLTSFTYGDPLRPKEIAYYNPASVTTPSPGSQNMRTTATGRADHCTAQVYLDKVKGELWTTCQDDGMLTLKFTNGVWPFK
jgi:hypothetical protein